MSLCCPELQVETESVLMILGLQASSSIRSKQGKSLTACETKSPSSRVEVLFLLTKGVVTLKKGIF